LWPLQHAAYARFVRRQLEHGELMPNHICPILTILLAAAISHRTLAQTPPQDRPFTTDTAASNCLDRAVQPSINHARETFPDARRRFLAGLPPGYGLSVTTRLRDSTGHFEQVFVALDSIKGDRLFGHIASDIAFVRGFRKHQAYELGTGDILDWTILRPDSTEEGNFVGNFLDSLQTRLQKGGIPKPC